MTDTTRSAAVLLPVPLEWWLWLLGLGPRPRTPPVL